LSRSVTFNGITMFRPGGITRINADALAQIGLLSNAVVGLIGEADGGEPDVINTIDDPALAKETFTSGALANAIRIAFDPTTDPRVPGGAFRCQCVKTNQGTQSSLILYGLVPLVTGGPAYDTVAAGTDIVHVHVTTAGMTVSAHVGNYVRIGTDEKIITANDASTITAAFSAIPVLGTPVYILAPMLIYTSKDYGVHTNRIRQELECGSTHGVAWTTAFDADSQTGEDVGGNAYLDVEYIGQATTVVLDGGTTSGAGLTTTTVDATKTWVVNAFAGFFEHVSGGALAQPNLRKIASNTNNGTATVTSAFTSGGIATAPGIGAVYDIRRGQIRAGTAVSATANTITLEATIDFALNELSNLVIAITGGTGSGQKRVIATNTAGVSPVLTLVQPWNTPVPDGTSTYSIRYISKALGSFTGAAGVTTGFNTVVAVNGAAAATDLNLTLTQNQTITDLVGVINTSPNYMAYVSSGRNGAELVSDFDFDHGAVNVELRTDRSQQAASPFPVFDYAALTGIGDTFLMVNGVVRLTDAAGAFATSMVGQNITLATSTTPANNGHYPIVGVESATVLYFMNYAGVSEAFPGTYSIAAHISQTWNNHFKKDLRDVVSDINEINPYVTVTRAATASLGAGTGLPEFTGSGLGSKAVVGDYYKTMTGGTRGVSANTDFQNAFDTLARTRINHIVALISRDLAAEGYGSTATFASVAAQMAAHLDYCNGAGKDERGGYMGMKGTRAQIVAMANQFNHPDMQLCGQKITVLDITSTLLEMDEWAMAVAAAGMRAGMDEVGEPLTWKYIRTADLTQDSSWDPAEVTDANNLIENGVLFAENIQGKGIRFVRDLTTYVTDDNLAYAEGSVRDVVRYVSYGLRTYLEDRHTGRKAKPSNVTSIKDTASEFLEQCRSQSIIVDSTDPITMAVTHAFYNLRVKISGDIATVRVSVFPVCGLNFQLNDIYLQLPSQAA